MKCIKITVVTISLNSEKTIEKTILSVVRQRYDSLEYWIIDGSSTDSTVEIIKRYQKEYPFIHYVSEPDMGISDAFNKGIRYATGDYIGFINSDDQLYSNALLAVNETYWKTKADIICGSTVVIDNANKMTLLKKAVPLSRMEYEMPFTHQSCFVAKCAYQKLGGYSQKYHICMDYDLMCKMYHNGITFADSERILSVFQYGGTSCADPIKTIKEDMLIASIYGLSAQKALRYKMVHIPKSLCKRLLAKMHLYRFVYRIFKNTQLKDRTEYEVW